MSFWHCGIEPAGHLEIGLGLGAASQIEQYPPMIKVRQCGLRSELYRLSRLCESAAQIVGIGKGEGQVEVRAGGVWSKGHYFSQQRDAFLGLPRRALTLPPAESTRRSPGAN